jgi:hypothetical protein
LCFSLSVHHSPPTIRMQSTEVRAGSRTTGGQEV